MSLKICSTLTLANGHQRSAWLLPGMGRSLADMLPVTEKSQVHQWNVLGWGLKENRREFWLQKGQGEMHGARPPQGTGKTQKQRGKAIVPGEWAGAVGEQNSSLSPPLPPPGSVVWGESLSSLGLSFFLNKRTGLGSPSSGSILSWSLESRGKLLKNSFSGSSPWKWA